MTGPDTTPDLERMRADVAHALDEPPESIGDEDDLLDRGLDSIRLMSLVERWRPADSEIGFVDLAADPTLSAWSRLFASP